MKYLVIYEIDDKLDFTFSDSFHISIEFFGFRSRSVCDLFQAIFVGK